MDNQMHGILQMMAGMESMPPNMEEGEDGRSPLRMLQMFMPYVSPEYRKSIEMMTQITRLQQALVDYADAAVNKQSPDCADWRHHLLTTVRPHMSPCKQLWVDVLIMMIELNELMEKIRRCSHVD